MHWIVLIIAGLIAGFIASKLVNKTGSGLVMDIVIGLIGAFVGGLILKFVPGLGAMLPQHGLLGFAGDVAVAVVGAVLILVIYRAVVAPKTA